VEAPQRRTSSHWVKALSPPGELNSFDYFFFHRILNMYSLKSQLKRIKSKQQNGFTLIELMVVVAIVGVLSAVGLPELTKAQDRAKDQTAVATLTNAAKECSLSLISLGDDTESTIGDAGGNFEDVSGDCEIDGNIALFSARGDGATKEYEIDFNGGVPGVATEVVAAAG
jgi:prepilin-type N-terminal cleavage/methylation domain-containing protein